MKAFNALGYFQFENLIKNRIPFLLINLGADLENLFPRVHQSHLQQQMVSLKSTELKSFLKEKNLPFEQSIVFICPQGSESEKSALELEKAGFINVYFVDGGLEKLLKEKSS